MSSIDLQVSLRFPSVGESSGTLTRALGLGVPCIVQNIDAFSDFPEEIVTRVEVGRDAPAQLCEIFESFLYDPSPFLEKATLGRAFVENGCSLRDSAAQYWEEILSCSKENLAVSDFFTNFILPISEIIRPEYDLGLCRETDLAASCVNMLFVDEGLRHLAAYGGLEVVAVDDVLGDTPADLQGLRLGERSRKLFIIASEQDSPQDLILSRIQAFGCQRFDLICQIILPAWAFSCVLGPGDSYGAVPSNLFLSKGVLCVGTSIVVKSLVRIELLETIESSAKLLFLPIAIVCSEVL